ncbi:MAG TPA: hypothetical protein VK138_06640 [Acidiferrobacterales bacterium]|nr:hypothetical protein [Acidiferrobacterales bacterium]
MTIRFLTYLVKPWDELNLLLSQRFAFQPEMSDVTRLAGSLAVAIKHQAEIAALNRNLVDTESLENRIMSDVADAWKHGKLKDSSRDNHLIVGAQFEYRSDNQFRFLRNVVTVDHASLGKRDFMLASQEAILYWIQKLQLPINWVPSLAEGPADFHDVAFLYFNPKYQISMQATNLQIVLRHTNGDLIPYDPPEVKFAVHKYSEPAT